MDWTQLSSIITIGTGIVIAGATWEIMKLNNSQAKVAEQKQKDDLFKIRWEVYHEIIKEMRKHYDEAYAPEPYNEEMDRNKHYELEFLSNNGLTKEQYKEIFYNNLISKVRWLFNDEIAILVKKLLTKDPIKYSEENEKYIRITFDEDTIGTFSVTEEFTKNFDKYLKLK